MAETKDYYFKPGNPGGGRPKDTLHMRRQCRKFANQEGINFFMDIARGNPMKVKRIKKVADAEIIVDEFWCPSIYDRIDAYKWLWTYGHGKPCMVESIDEEGAESVEDVIDRARKRAAELAVAKRNELPRLPQTP